MKPLLNGKPSYLRKSYGEWIEQYAASTSAASRSKDNITPRHKIQNLDVYEKLVLLKFVVVQAELPKRDILDTTLEKLLQRSGRYLTPDVRSYAVGSARHIMD